MSGALLDSLREIADSLPDRVAQCAAETAQCDKLIEGALGLAIRREVDGLLVLVLSGDPRTARDTRSQVRAFLGPSYARGRPPSAYLPPGVPFNDDVHTLAASAPLQAILIPTELTKPGLRALDRLLAVRERQPQTTSTVPRPLAQILRDFEDAIVRADLAGAANLITEATATGRLSLVNRSLLESRILTASGDYAAAVEHAIRHRLPDLRLPGPVEHDLIRACWHRWLSEPFQRGIEATRQAHREYVAPQFGSVYRDHRLAASREARLAWLIHYATIDPVPLAAMREVIAEAPESEWIALEATLPSQSPAEPRAETLRELQHGGENAAAYVVARDEPDLEPVVRIDALRRSADRLNDPVRRDEAEAIARTVESTITSTPDAKDIAATPAEGLAGVDDWGSWLAALYDDPENPDAGQVRRRGAERWTEALEDGAEIEHWAEPIEVLAGEPAFRDAMPQLVRAVLPSGPDADAVARRRQRVLLGLAYALSAEPAPGAADLDAIADVAGALLVAGVDSDAYLALAGQMEQLFGRLSAPPRLARWVVDVVELLLTSSVPSEEDRDTALRRIVAPLLPDATRLRPLVPTEVWAELVELLEGRQGLEELLAALRGAAQPQEDDADPFAALLGRSVLLHTLVAAAGERARSYLLARAEATVWADDSKVASNQLRDRARRAAIVVVASKAAKHAAYDAIKAAAGDRLHYASGKGWSSLVTAVRQALTNAP
jgi:hypothetical protein